MDNLGAPDDTSEEEDGHNREDTMTHKEGGGRVCVGGSTAGKKK